MKIRLVRPQMAFVVFGILLRFKSFSFSIMLLNVGIEIYRG